MLVIAQAVEAAHTQDQEAVEVRAEVDMEEDPVTRNAITATRWAIFLEIAQKARNKVEATTREGTASLRLASSANKKATCKIEI